MESALAGRHILVVEDDYLLADCLREILVEEGAQVVGPAATVQQALQLIKTQKVDGGLLDVNIARDMVYPVADKLMERGIAFSFCSGYEQRTVPDSYQHIPYRMKPFSPMGLAHALADLPAR